ncbi:MAG: minichromosome maintenance protein MCM, partial [Methanophagales archaeon]|nr:minichromosome maintenance protein MCM [Methanophagales archaeon]
MMQDLVTERWEDFLKRYCWTELIEMSNSYPEKRSLFVKFADMDIYDPNLADMLLEDPDVAIEAATRALREMDIPTGVTLDEANLRIIKLPRKVKIRDIRSNDIGKLVSIEGLVTKATEVRPRVVEAVFECPFCGHIFSVEQGGRQFKEPRECERESGGCGRKVQHFKLLVDKCKFANAQKIRLQESPEELRGGELPQAIDVNLEDDISGEISPGDRVIVAGILRSYQRTTQFGKTPFFDIYLDGNSLEIMEEEFEEIEITEEDEREIMGLKNQPDVYEKLIRSIAPSIYGYEEIKEAMVLQLFAGIPKELPDETRVRGDIHLLLVGDPGVAKSQLLTYLVKLAPRGLYTGGKSSTSAGLTAAAVRDEFGEGRWTLEAGALVLADKGIAAVDEIDKMKKEDRDALHEAMEQQTVSIAKAGIMARLNARCSLLAAANPKYGRFDKYTAIAEQINMPPTLLSRFDLIFTMMDRPNEEMDTKTAEHILETH